MASCMGNPPCGRCWRCIASAEAAASAAQLAASAMSAVNFTASVSQQRTARVRLFLTGFAQVICVSANTVFIAHYQLIANVLTALMLSLMWTWNVKKVAFGDWTDRWMYASGAALGSVAGTIAANHAMRWLS